MWSSRGGRDFQQILQTMKLVDVKTPALWYEFRQPHFNGGFGWRMNVEMPTLVYEGMQRF